MERCVLRFDLRDDMPIKIVCKLKDSPYKVTEKPSRYWIKVKNAQYSQSEGAGVVRAETVLGEREKQRQTRDIDSSDIAPIISSEDLSTGASAGSSVTSLFETNKFCGTLRRSL